MRPKPIRAVNKSFFEPGDWVWVHMRKERFLIRRWSKLHPRRDGQFQVLERINDNAYKLDLPGECNISATFNISDLSPFDVGDDLKMNPFEERGNNNSNLNRHALKPNKIILEYLKAKIQILI